MKKTDIERSIVKKYRKEIWVKFIKAIKEYDLIKENDKIAVCISGGKDSILLALLFQELKSHNKFNFEVEFICMDPGYNKNNINLIKENCKKLNIPVKIFKTNIFKVTDKISNQYPCYLCARMRRGHLYNYAKELGCNKIALGHHFNDVVETIIMNLMFNGSYKTMMPKLKSDNFESMELIRPMYLIKEEDIIRWKDRNELVFLDCACSVAAKKIGSKRVEVKNLINELKKVNKDIERSIFKSSENIYIDAILGYRDRKEKTSFLDKY